MNHSYTTYLLSKLTGLRITAPLSGIFLGQKSCRTKVPRIFRIFVPDFLPNFPPNFPRIFQGFLVLRFVGNGDQKKFTKNPRHFSMQNSQAKTEKIFTKCFWRAGNVRFSKGGGGKTEGGGVFRTAMRGTMFVCNGAVTPGPSRECDITFFRLCQGTTKTCATFE